MARYSVSSACWLHWLLASCLSLGCGKVTTPGGPAARPLRGTETSTEEPALRPPPGDSPIDAGADPNDPDNNETTNCNQNAVAGLSILVSNAIGSAAFECAELRVNATATDFEEQLECSETNGRCRCFGAYERPGTYLVTVQAGDPPIELAQSREIDVEMDDENCHVETESVTLRARAPEEADAGVADAGGGEGDPDPDPVLPDAGG